MVLESCSEVFLLVVTQIFKYIKKYGLKGFKRLVEKKHGSNRFIHYYYIKHYIT